MTPMEPRAIIALVVFLAVSMLLLSLYAHVHRLGIALVSFVVAGPVWLGILLLGYMCYWWGTGDTPHGPLAALLRSVQLAVRGY